jgi:hypothetical protein
MSSKIRIKNGTMEVEYEGTDEFIKNELLKLVSSVSELSKKSDRFSEGEGEKKLKSKGQEDEKPKDVKSYGTTANIAAKLNCKSGPDLIIAACAYLTFAEGKPSFGRQLIVDQMKPAAPYFKASYTHNLSNYLNTLLKAGKLNEASTGVYSLSPSAHKDLKSRLATS